MNLQERKYLIRQAWELVEEAQELVDTALKGTRVEVNYETYGRYGFNNLLGNGNPYDSSLSSLLDNEEELMTSEDY